MGYILSHIKVFYISINIFIQIDFSYILLRVYYFDNNIFACKIKNVLLHYLIITYSALCNRNFSYHVRERASEIE